MDNQYVKIFPGYENARMNADNWRKYSELVTAEESPGEGWYPVQKGVRPELHPGQILWWTYSIENGVAMKNYFANPPSRTFRRSWLAQWMYANGKWDTFTAFIEDNAYSHLRFLWEICTEFDEDNLEWPTALAAIKAALQLTDADVDDMLVFGETGTPAKR